MKNNREITVSAPGKLLIMGDHAVVYGFSCLVTAVSLRVFVTVTSNDVNEFALDAPDAGVSGYRKSMDELGSGDVISGARFIEAAVKNFIALHPVHSGVTVKTRSEFPPTFGFGSSSASVVAAIKALSVLFDLTVSDRQLFDLAYKTVLDVQGTGSGFDVAAAIRGGTFIFNGKDKTASPLPVRDMPLVVGYTGVKADTAALIRQVSAKRDAEKAKMDRIFLAIGALVDEAEKRVGEGDWARIGRLMDFNQDYLRDIGVSSEKLETLISSAKNAGAWGAKLSGAGGGDCMVALVSAEKRDAVTAALSRAGGTVMEVRANAPGVRVETSDNQEEQLIVVDRDDRIIGYNTRFECHHNTSLIHRTVGALIFNDHGQLLLQKRSKTKDMEAGLWGISAAGHVSKGQSDEEAAHRELQEELGIDVPLTFVKKFVIGNESETERAALYRGTYNGPFTPDPQEVDEVRFFDPREIKLCTASRKLVLTDAALQALKEAGVL